MKWIMAILCVVLLAGRTFADSMLTGTWEDKDKGLKVVFENDKDGFPTGKLIKGEKEFKFDSFSSQESDGNATINGNFLDGSGNSFPFSGEAANGRLTFRSGKTTYNMVKAGGAAPAKQDAPNPLESAAPNPLEGTPPANNPPANNPPRNDPPRNGPPAGNVGGDPAVPPRDNAGEYRDRNGLYSLKVPPGWTQEASPDGNSITWKHPSGALVFITTIPNSPFQSGKDLYKQGMEPGLKQNGAKIVEEGTNNDSGGQGYMGSFERTRNNVEEYGECLCLVVKGNGVIFQFSEPANLEDKLAPEIDLFWNSFKVVQ